MCEIMTHTINKVELLNTYMNGKLDDDLYLASSKMVLFTIYGDLKFVIVNAL